MGYAQNMSIENEPKQNSLTPSWNDTEEMEEIPLYEDWLTVNIISSRPDVGIKDMNRLQSATKP